MNWRAEQVLRQARGEEPWPDGSVLPAGADRVALLEWALGEWDRYPCHGFGEGIASCTTPAACDRGGESWCPRRQQAERRGESTAPTQHRVPPRIREVLEGRLSTTPALVAGWDWLDGRRPWLLLAGPQDGGKSVAAARLLEARGGGVWVAAYDALELAPLGARLLVLDGLDAMARDARGRRKLEGVLEARGRAARDAAGLRTIMTADLVADGETGEPLRSRLGERVWEWVRELALLVDVPRWRTEAAR